MEWKGKVERMGERRGTYRILVENMKQRGHLEDLGINRRTL
jgi:hypothetical protein